mgnify:CR=1 FL=1
MWLVGVKRPVRQFERQGTTVKQGIHPEYHEAPVRCACGNEFVVGSTKKEIRLDICSKCHPFFTGKQKFVDTAGRVDKYFRKYGEEAQRKYKKKRKRELTEQERAELEAQAAAAEAEAAEAIEPEPQKADAAPETTVAEAPHPDPGPGPEQAQAAEPEQAAPPMDAAASEGISDS